MWKCEDCGLIRVRPKRQNYHFCQKCSVKGERNPNFGNHKLAGKNNPMFKVRSPAYIDGRTNKQYYCKIVVRK